MKQSTLWAGVSVLNLAYTIDLYAATLRVYLVALGFYGRVLAQAIYICNVGSAAIGVQIRVYV